MGHFPPASPTRQQKISEGGFPLPGGGGYKFDIEQCQDSEGILQVFPSMRNRSGLVENVLQGTISDLNDPRGLVAVAFQMPLGLTRVRQLLMCDTYVDAEGPLRVRPISDHTVGSLLLTKASKPTGHSGVL